MQILYKEFPDSECFFYELLFVVFLSTNLDVVTVEEMLSEVAVVSIADQALKKKPEGFKK